MAGAIKVCVFFHPNLLKILKKRMEQQGFTSLGEYIRFAVRKDLMEAGLYGDKIK